MSLHLIESRKLVTTTVRKRDGVFVSVVVHALLIVSTFTLASAKGIPVPKSDPDDIVYIAPPPEKVVSVEQMSAPRAPAPRSDLVINLLQPELRAPVVIPDVIPDIDLTHDAFNNDIQLTRRPGSLTSNGSGATSGGVGDGSGGISSSPYSEAQVDKVVSILSGYRTPRYPESMRAAGVQQTVNVEFVVDSAGFIEKSSLTFADGAHMSFQSAVREALANAKFLPAEVNGRRVRQRVSQAFVFSLGRDDQ